MRSDILACLLVLCGVGNSTPIRDDAKQNTADSFNNPVIWEDYPDLDVFRVGDVFYYSSSTFAFSPGAPVLKSYDLVNWTPVSHSVPTLNFGSSYNLNSGTSRAYVKGIWASTLRYRESTDTFYWYGCVSSGETYIWTSPGYGAAANNGEVSHWNWTSRGTIKTCYYDNGLLIDDDDTMYMTYGHGALSVAQLSKDGLGQVKTQQVYKTSGSIEGSRMYKINGTYYIVYTQPAHSEYVLKSDSPWGPYEQKPLVEKISGPLPNAGYSHQGGIVGTKDHKWYYVAFMDAYPGGRIPVVAPLTWSDGWPKLVTDGNSWGKSYPIPVKNAKTVPPITGIDTFDKPELSHEWEWNHNPDNAKWKILPSGGLSLQTATVTDDLYNARNTLTHRTIGPKSTGTFRIDISGLTDGDRAGAILFRDTAAYIGVHKELDTAKILFYNGLALTSSWATSSTGKVAATGPTLSSDTKEIWLQISPDVTPAFSGSSATRTATFSYSTDGKTFTTLGTPFQLSNTWQFFTGYRYGVFNFATKALGGQVIVKSFDMRLV